MSVVKPFNPFSIYKLYFPQNEILDWFGADCHASKQCMNVEFPPNLNSDKNWRGLAVCAAFSVHEHPTIFLDEMTIDQSYLDIRFTSQCPGVVTSKIGARLLYQQDVEEFKQSIAKRVVSFFNNLDPIHKGMADYEDSCDSCDCVIHSRVDCCMPMYEEMSRYHGFKANEDKNPSYAVEITETCEDDNSYVVTQQENLTEQIYRRKSGLDFDRGMIYTSCFPPTEILDCFNQHNGPSLTIQLPSNLFSDDNFIGLALCAYFSDPEHPTISLGNFEPEIPHYLVCHLETERAGLYPLHHHGITNEEFKKLDNGEFIWLSSIPRLWFSDQLKECNLIEASFASDRGGWRAQKCGLRFLYLHDKEEFKQTINHCMALLIDNQDPASHTKVDNERNKKQSHDDQIGSSKSGSFIPDPQQEILEGPNNLNQKDRGKSILQ